jgi:hypothetical protein
MADCIAGPIRATLVVVDGNGLMATSNSLVIPLDRNIAPIGGFSAFKVDTGIGLSPANVTVRVSDIFGRPVAGAVVLIVKTSGNVTEFPASVQTCAGVVTVTCPPGTAVGAVSFPVTWGANSTGSIELELGNLPPVDLSFP